ncbi:hypothetical protein [Pontibacter populi]|uniref:Uncharacterized protein n=1 Tax=Pontibacter populi TaxID=890055 RepID=A0ABV1RYL2_9BACT
MEPVFNWRNYSLGARQLQSGTMLSHGETPLNTLHSRDASEGNSPLNYKSHFLYCKEWLL